MNKDSKLIFENYRNTIIKEEDEKKWEDDSWGWTALKVLDPTGLSSYPDLYKAITELNEKPDILNLGKVLLYAFLALPNFGLLAAGAGGIGWASLKAAAKTALVKGTDNVIPITNKILQAAAKSPTVIKQFSNITEMMAQKKLLTGEAKDALMWALKHGGVDNLQHGRNLLDSMNKAGGGKEFFKTAVGAEKGLGKAAFGTGGFAKAGLRAGEQMYNKAENLYNKHTNGPSYPIFSKSKWEAANTGQTFPKQVGDTFLNGKTGQVMLVAEQTDKTDTSLKLDEVLPTPEKVDTSKAPAAPATSKAPVTPAAPATSKAPATPAAPATSKAPVKLPYPKPKNRSEAAANNEAIAKAKAAQTSAPTSPEKTEPAESDDTKAKEEDKSEAPKTDDTYKKDYTGVSIIDFLDQSGKKSDFASRKELATNMGIPDYKGTASQNLLMLNTLRSGKTEVPVQQATPVTGKEYSDGVEVRKAQPVKSLTTPAGGKGPTIRYNGREYPSYIDMGGGKYRLAKQEELDNPNMQLYIPNPTKGQQEYQKPNFVKVRREGSTIRPQSQFKGAAGSLSNFFGDVGNSLAKPFRK